MNDAVQITAGLLHKRNDRSE